MGILQRSFVRWCMAAGVVVSLSHSGVPCAGYERSGRFDTRFSALQPSLREVPEGFQDSSEGEHSSESFHQWADGSGVNERQSRGSSIESTSHLGFSRSSDLLGDVLNASGLAEQAPLVRIEASAIGKGSPVGVVGGAARGTRTGASSTDEVLGDSGTYETFSRPPTANTGQGHARSGYSGGLSPDASKNLKYRDVPDDFADIPILDGLVLREVNREPQSTEPVQTSRKKKDGAAVSSAKAPKAIEEEEGEDRSSCSTAAGNIVVDSTYLNVRCAGTINVRYGGDFTSRRLLLTNKGGSDVFIRLRTTNAEAPPMQRDLRGGFIHEYRQASFLQESTLAYGPETLKDVRGILKKLRRHARKYPDSPADLVVAFVSPLDTASGGTSFMQTESGAKRINATCDKVLAVAKRAADYKCEILQAVDMVIFQFPPTSDFSEKGEVEAMLEKLLGMEGRNIHFWEITPTAELQMLPPGKELPMPPKSLGEHPSFVQARAEVEKMRQRQGSGASRGISVMNPALPSDADLHDKLWGMYSAKCVHAWLHGEKGHRNVVVGVADSGISGHRELDPHRWRNPRENRDRIDNDGNGLVDDIEGWNFQQNIANPVDACGHGTHVAGTIAALIDGNGVVGCAPETTIMAVRQFGSNGKGELADCVRAVTYALNNGASIINNSWGGVGRARALDIIFERSIYMRGGLGVLMVNAAGNESDNNDIVMYYPANIDGPNFITVASYTVDEEISYFSNYGRGTVTTAAPGTRIFSTHTGGGYAFMSGTSMATPHVAGIAALVFGVFEKAHSRVAAAEVKDILRVTSRSLQAARATTQWGAVPDAMSAVLMARMGGMWCQMKCTDMIFELRAGESYAPTLSVRGYQPGQYFADIEIEVVDRHGNSLATASVPFSLWSSPNPAENNPRDDVAANAFSNHAVELSRDNPLCDVQVKYSGYSMSGEDEAKGTSAVAIVAIVLGSITAVAVLVLMAFVIYIYMKRSGPQKHQQDQTKESPKEDCPSRAE